MKQLEKSLILLSALLALSSCATGAKVPYCVLDGKTGGDCVKSKNDKDGFFLPWPAMINYVCVSDKDIQTLLLACFLKDEKKP